MLIPRPLRVCVCVCVWLAKVNALWHICWKAQQEINAARFTCFLHRHNNPFVMTAPRAPGQRINHANISLGSVNDDAFLCYTSAAEDVEPIHQWKLCAGIQTN